VRLGSGLARPRRRTGVDRGREITVYVCASGSASICLRSRSEECVWFTCGVRALTWLVFCFRDHVSAHLYVAPSRALVRLQRASCHRAAEARAFSETSCARGTDVHEEDASRLSGYSTDGTSQRRIPVFRVRCSSVERVGRDSCRIIGARSATLRLSTPRHRQRVNISSDAPLVAEGVRLTSERSDRCNIESPCWDRI